MDTYYTGKGDDGTTGLLGKGRVPKTDPRIEAVGAIDETTAALGTARSLSDDPELQSLIQTVQRDLYQIMSAVSATPENAEKFPGVDQDRVTWLEDTIEEIGKNLEMPGEFILPGGSPLSAAFSTARTIARRAERRTTELKGLDLLHAPAVLPYLNRLSSLCYVLELDALEDEPTPARTD